MGKYLALGALIPLMWFTVNPNLAEYCERDSSGVFLKDFVTSSGIDNPVVPLKNSKGQIGLCKTIASAPRA